MEYFWNKDVKRFMILMTLSWLMGGVLCNLAIFRYHKKSDEERYRTYAGIISEVGDRYPDVPQEEIIRCLTHASPGDGESVLRQYGILKSSELFSGQKNEERHFALWINVILLFTITASLIFLCIFWRGRSRKIRDLGIYVDRVSQGDYELQLQKNQEDELSGLRNELFKLTVLYKEQAKHALAGKQALSDSVANISHQLKTPLTSAVILTDNLLESPEMAPEVRVKFLREISRQLVGMKWLVITMLKLSRLDAGVVEFQRERVSLKRIAEEAMQNLEMMAQWKEVRFKASLSEIMITGDAKWLLEAVSNIVKNAIEHSPGGGVVEVEDSENEVYVQLSVKDHGEGIPDLDQKHLFERFYKASKVENENVGIGLALSKEIVERTNGSITVDSGRDGTNFMIRILKYAT